MDTGEWIAKEVHRHYYEEDLNCARTTLCILAKLYEIELHHQVWEAAAGLHGAGGFRAQCGLVEGGLIFLGIIGAAFGKTDREVVSACHAYAKAFTERFGSLLCSGLRPGGFRTDDPPHRCETLTASAILFTFEYVKAFISDREAGQENEK